MHVVDIEDLYLRRVFLCKKLYEDRNQTTRYIVSNDI